MLFLMIQLLLLKKKDLPKKKDLLKPKLKLKFVSNHVLIMILIAFQTAQAVMCLVNIKIPKVNAKKDVKINAWTA